MEVKAGAQPRRRVRSRTSRTSSQAAILKTLAIRLRKYASTPLAILSSNIRSHIRPDMGSANDDFKVYPSRNVPGHTIKLSVCDAYSPKLWIKQTIFWPLKDAGKAGEVYNVLRQGMARLLTDVPALTGITTRNSDDPRDLAIKVPSNGHVEFVFRSLVGRENIPDYASLASQGWPMTDLMIPCSPPVTLSPVCEGSAMFTVQLNVLDGGIALSFAFNHLLADGTSVALVEEMWSKHTADVSSGKPFQAYKGKSPDLEIRKRLSTPIPDIQDFEHPHWDCFPTEKSQVNLPKLTAPTETAFKVVLDAKEEKMSSLNQQAETVQWCIWHFSAENLERLKRDASGSDETQWISTIDALVGLFWSRTANALQNTRNGHETSLALFPMNIRRRLEPPLPECYIGNAVDILFMNCTLAELESSAGFKTGARCMRKAITEWSQSSWEAWLSKAATMSPEQSIVPNPLTILSSQNIGFNDLSKIRSNLLDWGSVLGRPDRLRYMANANMFANIAPSVRIHPRLADGGIEVCTSANGHVKSIMKNDEVMLRYGRLVTAYS